MESRDRQALVTRFNRLNVHDDNLLSVTIRPPQTRRNTATLDFEFREYLSDGRKVISFTGVANIKCTMDFDVMADNSAAQTSVLTARSEATKMVRMVRSQMSHWRTRYMPPQAKDRPIRRKVSSIRTYALFKLGFFGGTFEILAKNFKIKSRANE